MKYLSIVAIASALLLNSEFLNAQVGIGTVAPNASAALDVTATNKGFLPPRVALTSTADASTITSPATGLLVFNTATAGASPNIVTPGYYFFNGTNWVPVNSTYAPGQVIKMTMLPYSSIGQSTSTSIGSTAPSYTTLATYNYTPASASSYILVEYNTVYSNTGSNGDTWLSQITVNGTQITYNNQVWENATGGGTRSGTLFPLMGRYTNSSVSSVAILIQATRNSSDDNFVFNGDAGTWLKITEIAR
jgi:hypothetical protein